MVEGARGRTWGVQRESGVARAWTEGSVANLTCRDAEEFLHLAGEIRIQTEVEVFPLAEANEALRRVKESRIQGAAVLRIS